MRRKNLLVRLFRAISGESQTKFARRTGVHPVTLAQFELGQGEPSLAHLESLARGAGLTVAIGEQILDFANALRESQTREGLEGEDLSREISAVVFSVYQRLLRLPFPLTSPHTEDRNEAAALWSLLADLSEDQQLAVVRVARQFQTWALAERACEASVVEASRDAGRSASLARLALEIAVRVEGPEDWRNRIQGFAAAHVSNSLRVPGELNAADATFEDALRLWHSGFDPSEVLDPGRLLDLEASLRRDQRRFPEALALLEEALRVGRCPARYLINMGFTLEVMGEYGRAVETLLQAEPLLESQGDTRLLYMQRFNLAVNYCHLGGRYGEAGELLQKVRDLATERGDKTELVRVVWLEGRIAAGLGRPEEALRLLAQARQEFAARGMGYDVSMALLEEAVLLLEAGRATEVRTLTDGLAEVFESKGMHGEALAALKLFKEAAEREEATAELARRILAYLFRARHDQGLRFNPAA